MKKVIVLIGLPASGKSYLAKKYEKLGYAILDDLSIIGGIEKLKNTLTNNDKILIIDVYLCLEKNRKILFNICKNFKIFCIFFENDWKKCYNNMKYRMALGDIRKVEGMIKLMHKDYEIPNNVKTIKIWQEK